MKYLTIALVGFLLATVEQSAIANTAPVGRTITHVPLFTLRGNSAGDVFGGAVSGAGDVNADGFKDILVGASRDATNGDFSGNARIFSGRDGTLLFTFNGRGPLDAFGFSVSDVGDVNDDGRPDVAVGAPRENGTGRVHVYSGLDGSTLFTFRGEAIDDNFGVSVSGAGDVNGDGRPDILVGANGSSRNGGLSGSARVYSGLDGSELYAFFGNGRNVRLGESVSGAGDVNGDGRADLLVGTPRRSTGGLLNGNAQVFSGLDGSVIHSMIGDSQLDLLGSTVAGGKDVNGDGRDDFLVNENYVGGGNSNNNGSVRVVSGEDGSTLYRVNGDSRFREFGDSLSMTDDLDGDNHADFIVGIPVSPAFLQESGSTRVYSGRTGDLLYTLDGDEIGDQFGFAVSGLGDINGDGLADFIIGASDGGYARVFVSQIVPEPVSLVLFGFACACLLSRRTR